MAKRDPKLARSRLEALLSMATGAAAEVPAGLAGLYGAATGGSAEGVRMIDKVRGKLTYQPRDPRGQQEIAGALAPLMQKIEAGKSALGDGAFNVTGSPMAAAAAYAAPDALLTLLGARPALAAGRSASRGIGALVERSARLPSPAMGSPVSQIGAVGVRQAKWEPLDSETWDDGTLVEWGKTPFAELDTRVDLPRGDDIRNAIEQTVELDGLRATQPRVTRAGVYGPRNDSHGLPLVVESNGIRYIQDGHHRLSRELFDGNKEARVRFVRKD